MSNREPFWQSVLPPSSGLLHRCAYIRAQVGRFTNRNGRVNQTIPANRKSLLYLPGQNPAVSSHHTAVSAPNVPNADFDFAILSASCR